MLGAMELIFRPAARVVLLDEQGRILLFRIADAPIDAPSLWITPGGGLEPGESYEAAAVRELKEETGLEGVPLGPWVWHRRHLWRWGDFLNDQLERFFLVRVSSFEVSTTGLDLIEREVTKEYRWWSVEELSAATDETFVPRRLAELLRPLVAGCIPVEPIDAGV